MNNERLRTRDIQGDAKFLRYRLSLNMESQMIFAPLFIYSVHCRNPREKGRGKRCIFRSLSCQLHSITNEMDILYILSYCSPKVR